MRVSRKNPCPLYSSTSILFHNISLYTSSDCTSRFRYSLFHSSTRWVLCFSPVFSRFSIPGLHVSTRLLYRMPFHSGSASQFPSSETTPSMFSPQLPRPNSDNSLISSFTSFLARVDPRSQCSSIASCLVRDLTGPQASISTFPHPETEI